MCVVPALVLNLSTCFPLVHRILRAVHYRCRLNTQTESVEGECTQGKGVERDHYV